MIKDLVLKNRSCRRFHEDVAIERETLRELVDLARCSASGSNRQPLKYILSCTPERNAQIFPTIRAWARALKDWEGPAAGERPSAYIIILGDKEIRSAPGIDHGIAAQSMLLGARERGLGGCILGSADKEELSKLFALPERYQVLLVLALGKPKEKVVIDEMGPEDSYAYWRAADDVHHVPKRRLDDIIIG